MLCLMLGLDTLPSTHTPSSSKGTYFAATGFFCALGLYAYPPGRATIVAVMAVLPVAWFFYKKYHKPLLSGYAFLLMVAISVFAPQGVYAVQHWEHFNGRTSVVAIFNSPEFKANPSQVMLRQLDRNLRGPWDGSVNNTPQYTPDGEPQLDRVTGVMVIVGMFLTLVVKRLRTQLETWLWWLMLLIGWSLTQLLTGGTPNGARGIGYMPTLIYFAAVNLDALERGLRYLGTTNPGRGGRSKLASQVAVASLALLIVVVGITNVGHYIVWQTQRETRVKRYLYVTAREFPEWAATITGLASAGRGIMNVGQWREIHPIQDRGNP